MSEQLKESLSAAMDGETDAFELRRVLDEAGQSRDLREQWYRYHVMRDVLRGDRYDGKLRGELQAAFQEPAAAAAEPAEAVIVAEASAPTTRRRRVWMPRLGATAVAAAVAMTVLIGGGAFEQGGEEIAASAFSIAAEPAAMGSLTRAPIAGGVAAPRPGLQRRVALTEQQRQQGLMLRHIQQRAMNQASMASFVKFATFDSSLAGGSLRAAQTFTPSEGAATKRAAQADAIYPESVTDHAHAAP